MKKPQQQQQQQQQQPQQPQKARRAKKMPDCTTVYDPQTQEAKLVTWEAYLRTHKQPPAGHYTTVYDPKTQSCKLVTWRDYLEYHKANDMKKPQQQQQQQQQQPQKVCGGAAKKAIPEYTAVYDEETENMRNNKLKEVREEWHHSKFFFGKNKVMAFALGKSETDEYKDNLHRVSGCLRGQRGLLFTNSTKDEVTKWFESYADVDFARTGCVAEQEVALKEGPLEQFTHSMEPQLRQLGLPTKLVKGVVTLTQDYVVCKEGDALKPEQARILKLLGHQMAEFKIHVTALWSNDGTFELLEENEDFDGGAKGGGSDGENEEDD